LLVLLQHGSKRSDILSRRLDGWSAICRSEFLLPARAQVGRVRTVQAGGQIKLKTAVKTVAHSVAHFAAKPAQNTPKRCSTV